MRSHLMRHGVGVVPDQADAADACRDKVNAKPKTRRYIMRDMSRREAMETMLLASAGFTLTRLRNAGAQTAAAPQAFAGQHQPRPSPFAPAGLNGMAATVMTTDWQ